MNSIYSIFFRKITHEKNVEWQKRRIQIRHTLVASNVLTVSTNLSDGKNIHFPWIYVCFDIVTFCCKVLRNGFENIFLSHNIFSFSKFWNIFIVKPESLETQWHFLLFIQIIYTFENMRIFVNVPKGIDNSIYFLFGRAINS